MCHPVRNPLSAVAAPPAVCQPSPAGIDVLLRRLTASLAHNVNNALTGVIGYLELGRSQPGIDADVDACLRSSMECADQAADAVRRIVRCANRVAVAEAPATLSWRQLIEEAADQTTAVVGTSIGQVLVSASLVRSALSELLKAVAEASASADLILRLADEDSHCVLYIEGGGADRRT